MQQFYMQPLVDVIGNDSAALGVSNVLRFTSADINKPVKLIASDTYGLCAAGDEIEATCEAISAFTVNSGFSFGTINKRGRRTVTVGGSSACPFNSLVLAGPNAALNTAVTLNPVVQLGAPTKHLWRVISTLGGVGAVGSNVVIERINS